MKKPKKTEFNFETSLNELEKIVTTMEKGDLTLEDSLKYFEEGIILSRQCQNTLKEAEQKVKILVDQNNNGILKDFVIDKQENTKTDEE